MNRPRPRIRNVVGGLLLIVAAAAPAVAQSGRPTAALIHVGASAHVSADMPHDPHGEVEIDANPADASELLACSMVYPLRSPTSDVVTYTSVDSGRTWRRTLETQGGDGHLSWDPDCRYGPGHSAYALSEGRGPDFPDSYDRLDRSADGGRTWTMIARATHAERSFIVVDRRPGPAQGGIFLYGMGDTPNTIRVGYSRDGGKTFASQTVSMGEHVHVVNVGPGALLADGTLAIPVPVYTPPPGPAAPNFRVEQPGFIRLVRVRVQRLNWPLQMDTSTIAPWFVDMEPNGSYYTTLAVDGTGGPFRDRLYAVWESRTSGRSTVMLAYSADSGRTWARPRQIDDDAPRQAGRALNGPDDIHGVVAVNDRGVVGVSWLDRRDHDDNLGWSLRFRASLDGGETFTPSVAASPVDYDPARGERVPLFGDGDYDLKPQTTNTLSIPWFAFHGGHTMGLAADAVGRFHPLWIANPDGTPQLWSTTLTVDGSATR
ncbi:MAG: exo-alpha-sialidase, partial [Gemmatimonadota bacterium]|nr:exo-alpha-sialidase [Gemmatimonadota bacterium]